MLKGIPSILSPELFKIMMEMGHGDELVIADGNFPSAAYAQRLVRADGHNVPDLLEAILQFLPLDIYVEKPVAIMQVVAGDTYKPEIWPVYETIICKHKSDFKGFESVERYDFYDRAKAAYAIIATGETALYANIILKKGVVV